MQPLSFLELDLSKRGKPLLGKTAQEGSVFEKHGLDKGALWAVIVLLCVAPGIALAHGVAEGDAIFLQAQQGFQFWPYFYLGAKHMVTGYDHLLFLAGIVFFLHRTREIATYVTLFAIGHSLTLIAGVWWDIPANAYLIDAIIGFSVVYKAFENLGGFEYLGWHIDTRIAVWVFGLFHGFGLATKLQALNISADGLLPNLLAFNLGVEIGQLLALSLIVVCVNLWRTGRSFSNQAAYANLAIMSAGFLFIFFQLTSYAHAIR